MCKRYQEGMYFIDNTVRVQKVERNSFDFDVMCHVQRTQRTTYNVQRTTYNIHDIHMYVHPYY